MSHRSKIVKITFNIKAYLDNLNKQHNSLLHITVYTNLLL